MVLCRGLLLFVLFQSISGQATCSTQLRLVGGGDQYAGRVEVLFGGVWQTVCDDSWDILEANVVCQQLGYGTGRRAVTDSRFGEGGSSQWERTWLCSGTESCLEDCTSFIVSDSTRCSSDQNAGVICSLSSVNIASTADGESAGGRTSVIVGAVVGAILILLCICGTVIAVVVFCLCCATKQRRARGTRTNASSTSPGGGSDIPMGNAGEPVPAYNPDIPTGGGSANQPPPATYLPGSYTVPSAGDHAPWPTGTKEHTPAPPYPTDTHNDLPPAYNSLLATPYPNDQGPPPPTSQYHYYAGTGPSAPSAPLGPQ